MGEIFDDEKDYGKITQLLTDIYQSDGDSGEAEKFISKILDPNKL